MSVGLDDAKTETLANFQSITGSDDMQYCVNLLQKHNWNIEAATTEHFEGNQHAPSPSPTPSVEEPMPGFPNMNPMMSNLFQSMLGGGSPMGFSESTQTPPGIPSQSRFQSSHFQTFFNNMVQTGTNSFDLLSLHKSKPPSENRQEFFAYFKSKYGELHPSFFDGTHLQALEKSKKDIKFLLIYLHSKTSDECDSFVQNTFCSESVIQFLDEHFIVWVADANSKEGREVATLLYSGNPQVQLQLQVFGNTLTTPLFAVLFRDKLGETKVLQSLYGNIGADDFIAQLVNIMDTNSSYLDEIKENQIERENSRKVREEQERAFMEALIKDQAKELGIEPEISNEPMQTDIEHPVIQPELKNSKLEKFAHLPDEPADSEPDVTAIAIRLLDGSKIQRKFRGSEKLQDVLDFVDTWIEQDIGKFELVSNFPSRNYPDLSATLKDLNLCPQAVLFLKEKSN